MGMAGRRSEAAHRVRSAFRTRAANGPWYTLARWLGSASFRKNSSKTHATCAEARAAEGPRYAARIDMNRAVKRGDSQKPNCRRSDAGAVRRCVRTRVFAGRIPCKGNRQPETERHSARRGRGRALRADARLRCRLRCQWNRQPDTELAHCHPGNGLRPRRASAWRRRARRRERSGCVSQG